MVNVAADIDEVRDIILALMPRFCTRHWSKENVRDARYIAPAKLNTYVWTLWTKKQPGSGSTSVLANVLVN